MNFFGHALIASWWRPSPAYALGAMLPDFAGMCRGPLPAVAHPEIAAGIELHHATDRVFHRSPAFRRPVDQLARHLVRCGLGRGPAAGAAHVAIELCLDGVLLEEDGAAGGYLAALACARQATVKAALVWTPPENQARWEALIARLLDHGVPTDYREPDRIAERVARALSGRPLLAMDAAAQAVLRREMPAVAARAAEAAPILLADLRAGLAPESTP
jgi:hypothetical protein